MPARFANGGVHVFAAPTDSRDRHGEALRDHRYASQDGHGLDADRIPADRGSLRDTLYGHTEGRGASNVTHWRRRPSSRSTRIQPLETSYWVWGESQSRVFHLIRDPRDVIISAMHYHSSAGENWLHRPRKVFRGLSYQDKLKSLADDRARFAFEMRHTSRRVIQAMQHWDYEQPNSLECRYEDLIEDVEGLKFTEVMLHLGFVQRESVLGRNIFRKNSLFGKKKRPNDTHIRSGARRQWESVFNRQSAREFVEEFRRCARQTGVRTGRFMD